jgi:very-short-patch-repair endonuclease
MHNEARVRAIQARQLGLISGGQSAGLGLTRKVLARQVAEGRWERCLPGVFRDVLAPASFRQSSLAAVLWAGEGAVVSHAAAGALWRIEEVEPVDRRMIGPIPVTSPARTLIDLAGILDAEALHAAVENAIHRGLTTPMSIGRRLDALGGKGRSGSGRLREILSDRGTSGAAESRLEVKIWRTLRASGMQPVRQHVVRCGDRTYRIDCAFPQWRLGVEGVGDAFHRSALERRRDHARLADLASISWRMLPVTWHAITETPERVVEQVLRALADAA